MNRQHAPRRSRRTPLAACAVAAVVLWAGVTLAQEALLPAAVEASLLVKILAFDREMAPRAADGLVIGVIYQERFRTSRAEHDEMRRALAGIDSVQIGTRRVPVTTVSIDIDREELTGAIAARHVDVLYVTPLRAVDIRTIAAACHDAKVATFSGVPDYTRAGLAVGLGMRREKAEIFINIAAARAAGCDYQAQLLAMATIVQ